MKKVDLTEEEIDFIIDTVTKQKGAELVKWKSFEDSFSCLHTVSIAEHLIEHNKNQKRFDDILKKLNTVKNNNQLKYYR